MKTDKKTLDALFDEEERTNIVLKEYKARLEEYTEKVERASTMEDLAKKPILAAAAEYILDIISDPNNKKRSISLDTNDVVTSCDKPSIDYEGMSKKLLKEEPRFTKKDIARAVEHLYAEAAIVKVSEDRGLLRGTKTILILYNPKEEKK